MDEVGATDTVGGAHDTPPVQIIPEGQVAFGIQLPVQSQSTIYVEAWERGAGPAELARVARQAEESGFFYVAVCDHTAIPRRLADAMSTTWYDTIATLGWLAGVTSRVRLLSHVFVAAQRHPLRSAKEFATLDVLSQGRLIIGVGAGHVQEEFDRFGPPFEERGAALDEAIDALGAALVDEFPTLPGPRWPAADLGVAPRPVQQPRPPIWVGGSSNAALRRAAHAATGGFPRRCGAATCATRWPGCSSCGAPCAPVRPSRSAPWPAPSTWGSRTTSCRGARCRAAPSAWPRTWPS